MVFPRQSKSYFLIQFNSRGLTEQSDTLLKSLMTLYYFFQNLLEMSFNGGISTPQISKYDTIITATITFMRFCTWSRAKSGSKAFNFWAYKPL